MTKTLPSLLLVLLLSNLQIAKCANRVNVNHNWRFMLSAEDSANENFESNNFYDSTWEQVALPHNAHNDQWQDVCWHRKTFDVA
ncbi:MAG: hypothetical protein SNH18_07085 [Rikenellaceae bacterium]